MQRLWLEAMTTLTEALDAKTRLKRITSKLPGVMGVGVAWDENGEPCLRVNLAAEVDDTTREQIPSEFERIPVEVAFVEPLKLE